MLRLYFMVHRPPLRISTVARDVQVGLNEKNAIHRSYDTHDTLPSI